MKRFTILLISLIAHSAMAQVHTWHLIEAQQGSWHGRLAIISGEQGGYFADNRGTNLGMSYDFTLTAPTAFHYGFGFDPSNTDFNVAYSITLYQNDSFKSKACVFTVTAAGPAKPDIRINRFNNALCETARSPGEGTAFYVG